MFLCRACRWVTRCLGNPLLLHHYYFLATHTHTHNLSPCVQHCVITRLVVALRSRWRTRLQSLRPSGPELLSGERPAASDSGSAQRDETCRLQHSTHSSASEEPEHTSLVACGNIFIAVSCFMTNMGSELYDSRSNPADINSIKCLMNIHFISNGLPAEQTLKVWVILPSKYICNLWPFPWFPRGYSHKIVNLIAWLLKFYVGTQPIMLSGWRNVFILEKILSEKLTQVAHNSDCYQLHHHADIFLVVLYCLQQNCLTFTQPYT